LSQKIAVIGSGISGLVSSYLLSKDHEVHLFEQNDYIGGHTHTVDIHLNGNTYAIDTGFIVFNLKTYPNFCKILQALKVEYEKTEMSFSYSCEKSKLEYNGHNLNTLFADRKNIFNIKFYKMLADVVRFNKDATDFIMKNSASKQTIGQFFNEKRYGKQLIDSYFIPMVSAIWSATPAEIFDYQAYFILKFFHNHGLLNIQDRPQWYVIKGGSRNYINPMIQSFKERINLSQNILAVIHEDHKPIIKTQEKELQFDAVVIATHSNEALRMLKNPTQEQVDILSAIPYQENEVILHYDSSVLPKRKLAWASWNAHSIEGHTAKLTYYMNRLQNLNSEFDFCVSMNYTDYIDPNKILKRFSYSHPIFSQPAVQAQQRWNEINGKNNIYFCGAYWGSGFHEDGVNSALAVAKSLGITL
jgi:predicted NAD/FAD-binding protein